MGCLSIAIIAQVILVDLLNGSPIPTDHALSTASNGKQQSLQRSRRSLFTHDYICKVFENVKSGGTWKKQSCTLKYNCHTVSSHHCSNHSSRFFHAEQQLPKPCSIDFRFSIKDNSSVTGFDLAFYKASEPNANLSDVYLIYFLLAENATSEYVDYVYDETINASCSGWQMFHLDYIKMANFIKDGLNIVNFEMLVFKNDEYFSLPCDEVHSLFVFNTTAHQASASSPTPSNKTDSADSTNAEGDSKMQENPFSLQEERMSYYVPVLNIFEVGQKRRKLEKREAQPIPTELDITPGIGTRSTPQGSRLCQRRDRWVKLNSTISLDREKVRVIAPKIYNIGSCEVSKVPSLGKMPEKCLPKVKKPVKLLIERWRKGSMQLLIQEYAELKAIEACG